MICRHRQPKSLELAIGAAHIVYCDPSISNHQNCRCNCRGGGQGRMMNITTRTGSKRSMKSDESLTNNNNNNAPTDGLLGRLLPWQKRTITGLTDSRADAKLSSTNGDNHNNSNHNHKNSNSNDAATDIFDNNVPRLVLRNLPYSQSHNNMQVRHNYTAMKIYKLIQHDWFHVLLRFPTIKSLFMLISIWTVFLVIWAGCYVWVDNSNVGVDCGLGPNGQSISFRGAFAFSLQTTTTGM